MNNLKRIGLRTLLFWVFFPLGSVLLAQTPYTVKGELIDSATNKGAEYATVALLNKEGVPISSVVSAGNGKFTLKVKEPGEYSLAVSSIGYMSLEQKITINQSVTDLGKILFIPGVELENVVVSTTKPLIRSDIDKIAYSVENDPETPVSTALDILRKVPLVTVDGDDNVYLQGQSNYKVLMNGKESSMLSRNFKEMMRSMPASSIKDIEVITNPSSKYEAEGVGGIINIVTNRRNDIGYSGNIGTHVNTLGNYGGYTYASAKLGKLTLSLNLNGGHHEQKDNRNVSEQLYKLRDSLVRSESSFDFKGNYLFYQAEASYEIDTFNLITMSVWSYNNDFDSKSSVHTDAWNGAEELVRSYDNRVFSNSKNSGLSGNIDYQRTFKKPDRTFTVSYKLENSPQKQKTETHLNGVLDYPSYWQYSKNDAFSRSHTFQVDYADPITPKHFIEAGAKYILRINDSDPETYRKYSENEEWKLDPSFQNDLDYDQHILGVYAGYTFKLNKKMSFKGGARMESTWNDGVFTNAKEETKLDNNFFDVVPYVTVSYAPKPTNRMSLSYTQRLSRPGIWYLNPYLNDTDPNYWSQGNPNLDSEVAHQFNLTYGIFTPVHTLNLTASAMIVNNSIERISSVINSDPENEIIYSTYENIGHRERYGLSAYYSFRKGSAFSFSLNTGANYTDYSADLDKRNHGWTYRVNGNVRVGLWKDAAFHAFGGYYSPNVQLQGESSGMYFYGMGLNQRFLKKKLNFSVNLQHPFKKNQKYWTEIDTPDLYRRNESWNRRRTANFSLSYNFGKMNVQVKKAKRGIQNDDVKAGDGGSGGSGSGGTQP